MRCSGSNNGSSSSGGSLAACCSTHRVHVAHPMCGCDRSPRSRLHIDGLRQAAVATKTATAASSDCSADSLCMIMRDRCRPGTYCPPCPRPHQGHFDAAAHPLARRSQSYLIYFDFQCHHADVCFYLMFYTAHVCMPGSPPPAERSKYDLAS